MQKLTKQIGVAFAEHEAARISQIAKREDRAAAYIVRRMVREQLERDQSERAQA